MGNICVFCGSSMGFSAEYQEAAAQLGEVIAKNGHNLVYGGASVGLMCILADSVMANGGKVIGIMPKVISKMEITHKSVDQLIEVETMAERKSLMIEMSEAFVALPGGFGTLDEISEVLVLSQLRVADKPMVLLNINGFFDNLISFADRAVEDGFVRPEHRKNLIVADRPDDIFEKLKHFAPVNVDKWISYVKSGNKYI